MTGHELAPVAAPSVVQPAPGAHTAIDREVSNSTRNRILSGFAINSTRAYTRQWQAFTTWCTQTRRTPLPATGETLAEYIGHLADHDLSPQTIEQALAAIRTQHRNTNHPGLPDTRGARLVLRSYRRQRAEAGHRTRKAAPVTIDALRAMVDTCDATTTAGLRNRVILVLGLAMMGRRSELAALDITDLAVTPDGLLVTVRMSKTDQDAQGAEVPLPYGQHPDTCPVRVVQAWLAELAQHGHHAGRLLRSVDRHGRIGHRLSTEAINTIVRTAAVRAGLDHPEQYTAHSLRAGGATSAAKAGAPVSVITAHGRWREGSPVVLGYIRAVDRWRDNPMRGVGL